MRQHTIRKPVSIEGVGLHSGKVARVTIAPAPQDAGVVFKVRATGERIPARPESVINSHYATTLGVNGGTRIQTVEHLMAAVSGLGIDNVEVEVDGTEIPALDGSAKPFVAMLTAAGRVQQSARRRMLTLPCPLRVGSGGRWLHVVPSETFRITYTLDNDHPAIGTQALSWSPSERAFVEEFAPARTYGFLRDLGLMRKNGLARGGSLDNAIVLGNRGALNGLRYDDEFVRHKILDLMGDLALLGRPLGAHVIARNGGHALNLELVLAVQRAVGLERRAAATVPATADEASRDGARREGFVPAPGLAAI
jgi:UDP-3-O-[3-hydroxymyristoyl] N-acetylglucosamine deacetylase